MIPDYENMLEAIYRVLLQNGDIAIDIGAHTGRHTFPMLEAVGTTGKVIAFEPLEFAYAELQRRAGHDIDSHKSTLVAYNLALGEEEGAVQFVYTPDFPEYSGFKERIYHDDSIRKETIKVQVRRLDSYSATIGGKVRYIKVDAEGGELTILRGGLEIIKESLPVISFELGDSSLINYAYSSADYFEFFDSLGYNLFSIYGLPLSKNQFIAACSEQFYWDYIAIPNRGAWLFGHNHVKVLANQLNCSDHLPNKLPDIIEPVVQAGIYKKIYRRLFS